MKNVVDDALSHLGKKMKDKVTGAEGVVSSISFDLYGCVQATLNTGLDKEGKPKDQYWYDVKRLEESGQRVMAAPDFLETKVGGEIGAAEKPYCLKP